MSHWRKLSHHTRTLIGGLIIGTTITLIALLVLQGLPFFNRIELAAYDWHFLLRGDRPIPNNIVVVSVDNDSIQQLPTRGRYPIPRCATGHAIDFLHRAGAKAIGIDFAYFADSSYGPKDDQCIVKAMKQAGNVVVVSALQGSSGSNYLGAESSLQLPIDPIANAVAGIGLANVPTDADNVIRAAELYQRGPGGNGIAAKMYPAFPLEVASIAMHRPAAEIARGLPNMMRINYQGHQDPGDSSQKSYREVQFLAVANGEDNPRIFRNKIVLIIPAAIIAQDLHTGPFGSIYGGYVQANALNTILNRDPVIPVGDVANALIILILGLLTTVVAARFSIWHSATTMVVLFLGYAGVNSFLFAQFRMWANLISPEATVVMVFGGVMALRFATEERLKRKTNKIFGQYVKPEIVDILVNSPADEQALRGARRPISVLFVDVRGFTAMSERMEPEDVVQALDIYLEELTESVQWSDGTLDKYVGDELMAIWNAPRIQEDHPLLAVRSALDMVSRTDKINEQLRAKGLPAIRYGIGVNSGEAIVGEMGSSFRKQYDVIGDTVNTGARLCSAAGGGEIIIGETTWEMIGNRLVVEETEPLKLKGKSRPFRTFRVLSIVDAPAPAPAIMPAPAPVQ